MTAGFFDTAKLSNNTLFVSASFISKKYRSIDKFKDLPKRLGRVNNEISGPLITSRINSVLSANHSPTPLSSKSVLSFLKLSIPIGILGTGDATVSAGESSSISVAMDSTAEITEGNWDLATQASGEPSPSIAGSSESMTVSGLTAGTIYYFVIKTSDEVPNESDLSNVPSLSTTGLILTTIFEETFPNSDSAWNGSSDTAQDESGWSVIQGNGDSNDIKISDEDIGSSPSGGNHLTFEDCDEGFYTPETYDLAYVAIDLSGYTGVTIEYYWQSDDVDGNEGMRATYSTNSTNGIDGTWTQIAEYINPSDSNWTGESFALPDIAAVASFKLRFSSKSNATSEHMYVDDVKLTGYQ